MVKDLRLFLRYKHYDILQNKFNDVDDSFSDSIKSFKENLLRYPGPAGAVGYGKNTRQDLMAWIVLTYEIRGAKHYYEFPDVFILVEFLKKNKEVADALGYVPK